MTTRFHLALGVSRFEESLTDYAIRLGRVADVVVPGIYALWRTDSLNVSIRRVADGDPVGLRHLGWEDPQAEALTVDTDCNGIDWERFDVGHQADEIRTRWPEVDGMRAESSECADQVGSTAAATLPAPEQEQPGQIIIREARTDVEIAQCFDTMVELRTHLTRERFLHMVRHMEREGYRLLPLTVDGRVVAVAGYRIVTNLFMGKTLYVDDLVTAAPYRSRGYGHALVAALYDRAQDQGCAVLHLDSGVQRPSAHTFYFREGFTIASFHFSQRVSGST